MPKTKEEIAAYQKEYQRVNKAYLRRYKHMYYMKHREMILARRRAKYALDPEYRKYEIERHRRKREVNHD